jgi:uncharacterized metal-binding protein YceD (DUF177 family)
MTDKLYQNIDINHVIEQGRVELKIQANEEERAKIAQRCDILEVSSLNARITVTPGATPDLFKIKASLKVNLAQACSVTLAPVQETVDEVFNETMTTLESALVPPEDIDGNDDTPVELIENNQIDIGEMVAQWLALSLDPFPRSDAPFYEHIEAKETDEGTKTHTPFDVLGQLKDK